VSAKQETVRVEPKRETVRIEPKQETVDTRPRQEAPPIFRLPYCTRVQEDKNGRVVFLEEDSIFCQPWANLLEMRVYTDSNSSQGRRRLVYFDMVYKPIKTHSSIAEARTTTESLCLATKDGVWVEQFCKWVQTQTSLSSRLFCVGPTSINLTPSMDASEKKPVLM
jgi:hypothetical protein